MQQTLYGGIDLGGTKTICAIGDPSGSLAASTTFPTTTVEETLLKITEFFKNHQAEAIGLGSFGPLDVNPQSPGYGTILNTPKSGWTSVNIKKLLEDSLGVQVAVDLDVNCAALGELHYGVCADVSSFVYLTVGTGIGGGLVMDKQVVHGRSNLEMGHMRIPHEATDANFEGVCPFHGDCFEGLASGSAMEKRYGGKAENNSDPAAWNLEANYIAAALHNIMLSLGPERIVLGGGVMSHEGLLEEVRTLVTKSINGYLSFPALDTYLIVSSGDNNGVLGGIKLASMMQNA